MLKAKPIDTPMDPRDKLVLDQGKPRIQGDTNS